MTILFDENEGFGSVYVINTSESEIQYCDSVTITLCLKNEYEFTLPVKDFTE